VAGENSYGVWIRESDTWKGNGREGWSWVWRLEMSANHHQSRGFRDRGCRGAMSGKVGTSPIHRSHVHAQIGRKHPF
jgi:hypothetical protein